MFYGLVGFLHFPLQGFINFGVKAPRNLGSAAWTPCTDVANLLVTHLQEALEAEEVFAGQSQRLHAHVHADCARELLQFGLILCTLLVYSLVEAPALDVTHCF